MKDSTEAAFQRSCLGKGILNICSKFTGEHPCQCTISIKLQSNFIEIALRHGSSPVDLLHIFRTIFLKDTSRGLFLIVINIATVAIFQSYHLRNFIQLLLSVQLEVATGGVP